MVRYGWYMCFPWYLRLVRLVGTVGTVGSYRTKRANRTATSVPNVPPNRTDEPGGRFSVPMLNLVLVRKNAAPLTPPLTWYGSSVQLCGTFFLPAWYGRLVRLANCTNRTIPSVQSVPAVPYQAHQPYQAYRTKRTNRTKRTVPGF